MLTNRSAPSCSVIPQVPYPDPATAADWLCAAFGFTIRLRIGNHRIQMKVGGGCLILTEGPVPAEQGQRVMIRVADAEAHCKQAMEHGAVILRPPADYPYGERQYSARDFAGYRWDFTQSIADVDPITWGGTPVDLQEGA
jgi:uncharacterized glyoxalase superfamily protein PhnB